MPEQTKLTIEKLKLHERLLLIEQYIVEGKDQRGQINDTLSKINLRCNNIENMIHGNFDSKNAKERDGIIRRVEELEDKDASVEKVKNNFLKVAIGSITMAVGAFVLWVCKLIWSTMGK